MADPIASEAAPIEIVPMSVTSLDQILGIERSCFSDPWSARAFRQSLSSPHTISLVARDPASGRSIGYIVGWFVMDEGEIANVAVAADWRGRGIGGLLLDEVISRSRSRGVSSLYLEVREANTNALRLYASRGFEQVGRRVGYYRKPREDALVLRLRVGGAGEGAGSC
jgi:[ribosomal protein S18]-alanine N-acetyltransferase